MPQLPDRPDLSQLRRQARELHRAAADGDARALRQVRRVSEKTTLSTAQLAIARAYGFPSWPKLKEEVLRAERRRAPAADAGQGAPIPEDLTADAGQLIDSQLIDSQYADRPQLRPVLDAVLAVLPTLGPVTVQARRTIVSLVSPRRTFAVVQATTRTRVDLGLRLENTAPGGRLQVARNMGGATVRIALAGPGDVALGGHSADRTSLTMSNKPGMAIEPVPGDAPSARWEMPVTVRRDDDDFDFDFDFAGPYVRGVRDDRHLGLTWGDLRADGTLQVFRGAKLRLVDVDPGLIEQAIRPGRKLVARIRLTDARGNPICARVHPPYLTWSAAAPTAPGRAG